MVATKSAPIFSASRSTTAQRSPENEATAAGRSLRLAGTGHRRLVLTDLHQFSVFAASRGEGLHPKLRALLERAAASPFSEVSIRHDGLIQAGPSPASEVISSQVEVALFSR